ncbi:MAG: FAD-binding oxidoreductase [Planctomycetaceae bacterium]
MSAPPCELRPTTAREVAAILHERYLAHGPGLWIVGGETAAPPPAVDQLHITGLRRVIDYPVRDLTITVEAGMRVADLKQELAAHNQRLPVDVPQVHAATIGGAVACNAHGPGQFGHGTFRDYVIGIKGVDGRGRLFAAGGRVVKNVAGYDLCKLLVGSHGTLAAITELTFKLRPQPDELRFVSLSFDDWSHVERALVCLLTSQTRPVAIELLNRPALRTIAREAGWAATDAAVTLLIGYEGTAREVDWQSETLRTELVQLQDLRTAVVGSGEAVRLWSAIVEWPIPSRDEFVSGYTLRPSRVVEFAIAADRAGAALLSHAGHGGVQLRGATAALTELLVSLGGTVAHSTDSSSGTASAPRSQAGLERQLRQTFDPHGLLNPSV